MIQVKWYPDTCQCLVNQTKDIIERPCNLHKGKTAREVLLHNRSYNGNRSESDEENYARKQTERKRIKSLK